MTTLFVPTSNSGSGSLVRYKISGTTATKVGSYNMVSTSGSSIGGGAIRVIHYDDTNITFLFKSGRYCFTGTLPISQTGGNIVMTSLCTLDYSSCYVNGVYKDTMQSNTSVKHKSRHAFGIWHAGVFLNATALFVRCSTQTAVLLVVYLYKILMENMKNVAF